MALRAQMRSRRLASRAQAMIRSLGLLPAWVELGIYCVVGALFGCAMYWFL